MRGRLARLAPEELAAAILLGVALIFVAADPHRIGRVFEPPYATPAPESGAATFLRDRSDPPAPSVEVAERTRVMRPPLQFLQAPVVGSPAEGRIVIYDRSGTLLVEIADPCWEAATTALRTGQPVVCAPRPVPQTRLR